MKLLVTGGSGFTGKYVLHRLQGRSNVRCLIRKESQKDWVVSQGFEPVRGDVRDSASLFQAMQGCQGLINIVSLGFGDASNIIAATEKAGIERALFVSTTAVETKLTAKSKSVRLAAEKTIQDSRLAWTILRPTMIYGGPGDRNMTRLLKALKWMPLVCVPGSGGALMQPVLVDDLALAIASSFDSSQAIGRNYTISGKDALTFNAILRTASEVMDKKRMLCHLPAGLIIGILHAFEKTGYHLPVKEEQVQRLLEDKAFSHEEAAQDFGYAPHSFQEGIQITLRRLRGECSAFSIC